MLKALSRLFAGKPPDPSTAAPDACMAAYKRGCALEEAESLEAAAEAYRAALQIDSGFAKAHNNLGATLQKMGDLDNALQCFLRARSLDPALWQAPYNIGNLHKLEGRIAEAVVPFQDAMRLRRDPDVTSPELAAQFEATSRSKLLHDIEQLNYLLDRGLVAETLRPAVSALTGVLSELAPEFERAKVAGIPPHLASRITKVYNRLLHFHDAPALTGAAVNPRLDASAIEADYFRNTPGFTYVDDFLTPEALSELRRFCLESTIWFDYRYSGGYIGGSLEEGFICPLLAQIAAELPRALPGIFGQHKLTHLWGYKYDSECSGISQHADFAAVNVNFWLAPDAANLDPASGGLVVWDKEAPLDWDFEGYNNDAERSRRFLAEAGAKAMTVAHRQNRVVIFNSDLFHKTDSYSFRAGYENRRINVTYLYGYRQQQDDPMRHLQPGLASRKTIR